MIGRSRVHVSGDLIVPFPAGVRIVLSFVCVSPLSFVHVSPLLFILQGKDSGCHSDAESYEDSDDSEAEGVGDSPAALLDLEDMGKVMQQQSDAAAAKSSREMVTPTIRKNLEKQGYKIVGSHSGVKLCSWTKVCVRVSSQHADGLVVNIELVLSLSALY